MGDYVIREGDCLSSIADAHGHFWKTIWDDPQNEAVKGRCVDPNTLIPGMTLFIPPLREREEATPTNRVHRFRKLGIPALARLQVFDEAEARANQDYVLEIDGKEHRGTTDGQGVLEVHVPPDAAEGRLKIGPDESEYSLHFGHLQPIHTTEGVQARLRNLGFGCRVTGELDEQTRTALLSFQRYFELEETADPDEATLAKLEETHDQAGEF